MNKSKAELKIKSAVLVSAIDGTSLPLEIEAGNEIVPIEKIRNVPGDARDDLELVLLCLKQFADLTP